MYFEYGDAEICYLKEKDTKLAAVIDSVGHIYREADTDLFSSIVHHIIGQQISAKAQATIWKKMQDRLENVSAENIAESSEEDLQSLGITYRKAEYIKDFALKVIAGEFCLDEISLLSDDAAIKKLAELKGIGVWTAEMILLFCLQRPDIFSYQDLAIQRGLRMIYHHRAITKELFEKYRRRFHPYCSTASLYIWAVAGGAIPEMKDPAIRNNRRK